MALTGQLSDMSLAELIEFFCNQRKTGRLKVDYHHGQGVFFIKGGELVDARVGSLSGAEAVYFALTLPNAAFDFSADFEPPRRTIEQSWKQVVLEGLRRLDEGASPRQSDAFGPDWTPTESDLAALMDRIERLDSGDFGGVLQEAPKGEVNAAPSSDDGPAESHAKDEQERAAPLSLMVESAGASGGGRKKLYVFGALACVVLACAVAAVPVARRMKANRQTQAPAAASQPQATQTNNSAEAANVPAEASAEAAPAEAQPEEVMPQAADPAAAAALAARREREARERLQRERERRAEEARRNEQADKSSEASADASKPAAPVVSGPKVVRVSVSYDENGRVTQASVAGATPGAEAYGSTALRVARGRRFPAGKPGGTVISIPVN